MTGRILAALSLVLGLAACDSGINLNPFTWFGGSTDEKLVAVEPSGGWPTGEDPRELVAQITALSVDRTTAGAIVHATGLPPKIGYWEAELVAENDGKPVDGVVTYRFHVWSPLWEQGTGSEYARSIDAGAFLSNRDLADIRQIRVIGARNAMTVRR